MQYARKSVTSDPFVVYNFYDMLTNLMTELDLFDKPAHIYNCDETAFPLDPTQTNLIGSKGLKTIRVTAGANRENYTVLATCSAAGRALDPLFIFESQDQHGKLQTSMYGTKALPNTLYGTSKNGWINAKIFYQWLEYFIEMVTERPILLILDGHSSHTDFHVVELANANEIYMVKLPPHCTDLLQPLDVACFSPVKTYYEKKLLDFSQTRGGAEKPLRNQFVNLVCKVWEDGLSPNNIRSGFRKCGIYPLDSSAYDKLRFDQIKLCAYDQWVVAGKQLKPDGTPLLPPSQLQCETLQDIEDPSISVDTTLTTDNEYSIISTPSSSRSGERGAQQNRKQYPELFPCKDTLLPSITDDDKEILSRFSTPELQSYMKYAFKVRHNMKTVLKIIPDEDEESMSIASVIKEQMKNKGQNEPSTSRKKIDNFGKLISQGEFYEKIKQRKEQDDKREAEKECRKRKREEASKIKKTKQQKKVVDSSSSDEESSYVDSDSTEYDSDVEALESEIDEEREDDKSDGNEDDAPLSSIQREDDETDGDEDDAPLSNIRKQKINMPNLDKDSIGKFYAVYYTEPKPRYYWGKIVHVFSHEEDGEINKVTVDFLRQKTISSNHQDWSWDEPRAKDVDTVETKFVFHSPELPIITKSKFLFNENNAMTAFNKLMAYLAE